MYLARVRAENFRIFGCAEDVGVCAHEALDVVLEAGVTVLVGENDSGKSAIVDAVRLCLLTTSADFYRVGEDDFHCCGPGRAPGFSITCTFNGLSDAEKATFLELLTVREGAEAILCITLRAQIMDPLKPSRISVTTRTGALGDGPALDGAARELLKATYLKPLRDAESELRSGRNSRLSQILASYPAMRKEGKSDFDTEADTATTLVGILKRAEHHIGLNPAVSRVRDDINDNYLSKFGIGKDDLSSEIGVSSDATLPRALERLELKFSADAATRWWTRRGLGYNNALFMGAELLLLGNSEMAPLLLIEEPEAHLHPQLQSRVMDLLTEKAEAPGAAVQVLLTTHSPHIAASLPVERITIVSRGSTFPLTPGQTKLDASDYAFLSRFLDATKANLFFARGVAVVEGDAENLLLPALAKATGRSFGEAGVSIVNVGSVRLFRFSRILQREGTRQLAVRVACITDRDLAPDGIPDDMVGENFPRASSMTPQQISDHLGKLMVDDGGPVRTFVSDLWTLEYDLAAASWTLAEVMHQAVESARKAKHGWLTDDELAAVEEMAREQIEDWKRRGLALSAVAFEIYRPLKAGKASKAVAAQHAARLLKGTTLATTDLPAYLSRALDHLCGPT
ncbi:ATP-dependent endonuclease [Embleya sp. NPDC059237]|uniref:ATP-dependent nuclease n=1 Tax=Embleya sp. NPDC059237 TaxID=3346784 RepID=UPI003691E142